MAPYALAQTTHLKFRIQVCSTVAVKRLHVRLINLATQIMAFIPNLRRSGRSRVLATPAAPTSFGYIDTLFDYGAYLEGLPDALGSAPSGGSPKTVAIIGAGIAGLSAAYELLRAGISKVVIYEGSGRIGGRAWSATFPGQSPQFLAELGAMRFPPSEYSLFHYLDRFGIKATSSFPDPGSVLTNLGYRGQTYVWQAGASPPDMFKTVNDGWNAFIEGGCAIKEGVVLLAPTAITGLLRSGQTDGAQAAWQTYIDTFGSDSFYTALRRIFGSANPPGGTQWRFPNDYDLFGALGVGSGGLGPMYPVAFLEIVRLIVDELETDQLFIPNGIESLARAFADQVFNGQTIADRIVSASVTKVARASEGAVLAMDDGSQGYVDRVIVTASTRAMQIDMALSAPGSALTPEQCSAIDDVHLTSSSKVFVMTERKFWLDKKLPANIQTDTMVRGVYCLDYAPDDPNSPGIVLLSYAWEDDAIKQLALGDNKRRVQRLLADLAQTNAAFAECVVPIAGDYQNNVYCVDWDMERGYYGAFKLNFANGDAQSQKLFFQFQDCRVPSTDPFIYVAGDSCSFTGGWVEGALQTSINAVCATLKSVGGTLFGAINPLENMPPRYAYGGANEPE